MKRTGRRISFLLYFALVCSCLAQRPPDSTAVQLPAAPSDSLRTGVSPESEDENSIDRSLKQPDRRASKGAVIYDAETIITDNTDSGPVISLINRAVVKFEQVTIKAGKITIYMNDNLVVAEALEDSTLLDSLQPGEVKLKALPEFSDGKETMTGEKMTYNFETGKGRIVRGRTKFDGGYYMGETVKIVEPKVFFVADGAYSTCDAEEPHFHFRGKKMKVIAEDKVIAKPIIFFMGKIPLALFPFAMFSTKADGRQSGIILPQYGSSRTEGRYLRNMGYYWAINEYMDSRFTVDFYDKTGLLFRNRTVYNKRYKYSGSVTAAMTRKNLDSGRRQRDWSLDVAHRQTFESNASLNVRGSFVTNNTFYKENSLNQSQRLRRQLTSNATLNKSWSQGRNSLSINLSQSKDLQTGRSSVTLPRLTFRRNQSAFFPVGKDRSGRSSNEQRWYNAIKYTYQNLVLNEIRKDSTGDPDANINRRAEHDIRLNFTAPNKIFGWLGWNQDLRIDEDWYDRTRTYDDSTGQETDPKIGFAARRQFTYNTSLNTNVYGTFSPRIGSITALRHKMSPRISFSYRPDFSDPFWGYYEEFTDSLGNVTLKDKFSGTSRGEQRSMNLGLNNLFQMKLGEGAKEKKVNLFNLNFSSGYNFARDSLRWQPLSTSFSANPRKNLSVNASMSHSFYAFDSTARREVNRLSPRLTRVSVSAGWSIGGKKRTGRAGSREISSGDSEEGLEEGRRQKDLFGATEEDLFSPENPFSALDIPWSAQIAFSYSLSKSNPFVKSKPTAYVKITRADLQLTEKWRIGYSLQYDLQKTDIVRQQFSFYRDLHCWEASFNWNPNGTAKGYYFRIGIKAGHLKSVKWERRGGSSSIF